MGTDFSHTNIWGLWAATGISNLSEMRCVYRCLISFDTVQKRLVDLLCWTKWLQYVECELDFL